MVSVATHIPNSRVSAEMIASSARQVVFDSMEEARIIPEWIPTRYRSFLREMREYIVYTAARNNSLESLSTPVHPPHIDDDPQHEPKLPPKFPRPVLKLDLILMRDKFKELMKQRFPNTGYSCVLSYEGKFEPVSGGMAQVETVPQPMTEFQPVQCASVSKVITTAAVLHAIKTIGGSLGLNSKLSSYCPKAWTPVDKDFAALTIHWNLNYQNGFPPIKDGGLYDITTIRNWIVYGAEKEEQSNNPKLRINQDRMGKPEGWVYSNASFGWYRFLLFYMTAPHEFKPAVDAMHVINPDVWHYAVCTWYSDYVKNNVLAGANARLFPIPSIKGELETLYYVDPYPIPGKGSKYGDLTYWSGGSGWYISAMDLAQFLFRLRWGNIIHSTHKSLVFNTANPVQAFGFDGTSHSLKGGTALHKHGALGYAEGTPPKATKAFIVQFPNGAQASGLSNCNIEAGVFKDTAIDAYQASWKWFWP